MRILISADIEGASGVTGKEECSSVGGACGQAGRWLTGDINAAVEGAMQAGATAFVVHDSHGPGRQNILLDELHPLVEVMRGQPVPFFVEADLGRGYDAAFLIGMHSRAAENAVLNPILNRPLLRDVRLNDRPVGEAELTAYLAGAYDIPTVLITGDDRVCLDVQRWSGGAIEAAVVKYSLSRYTARCLSLIEARERIRQAAEQAVRQVREARPMVLQSPITLELEFGDHEIAQAVAWMPEVGYDGEGTVRYIDGDFRRIYRVLLAALRIATSPLTP